MKRTLIYLIIILFAFSCQSNKKGEDVVIPEDISLSVGGNKLIVANDDNYQIGFNKSAKRYWVCNDVMDVFYIVELTSGSIEGASNVTIVKANVQYATKDSPVYSLEDVSFEILKETRVDNLTRYFLYSKTKSLGLVIAVQ